VFASHSIPTREQGGDCCPPLRAPFFLLRIRTFEASGLNQSKNFKLQKVPVPARLLLGVGAPSPVGAKKPTHIELNKKNSSRPFEYDKKLYLIIRGIVKPVRKAVYSHNVTRVGPSTMHVGRRCPAMGTALSGGCGRTLEHARGAGGPRKPCRAALGVTVGGFLGPF
jgi:hypothetical protein